MCEHMCNECGDDIATLHFCLDCAEQYMGAKNEPERDNETVDRDQNETR